MALSYVGYSSQTGIVTDYAIPFNFLNRSHVTATVDGVSAPFTWLNDGLVRMDTAPIGDLLLTRSTPNSSPYVTFVDGSTHSAGKHNTQNLQLLYTTQEAFDTVLNVMRSDGITFDALGRRILNVGTPTLDSDAATKGYSDTITAQTEVVKDEAEAARDAAEAAQVLTEAARDSTLEAFENFDNRYLGSYATDPTLDNDGGPLVGGMLYFNSVASEMRLYDGSSWVAAYVAGDTTLTKALNLSDVPSPATAFLNIKQDATEGATGVVQRATYTDGQNGSDTTKYTSPLTVHQMIDTHQRAATFSEIRTTTTLARATAIRNTYSTPAFVQIWGNNNSTATSTFKAYSSSYIGGWYQVAAQMTGNGNDDVSMGIMLPPLWYFKVVQVSGGNTAALYYSLVA